MIRKTDLRKKAGKFFAVMASAAMVVTSIPMNYSYAKVDSVQTDSGVVKIASETSTVEKNASDVAVLKKIIAEQKERGADVNENLNSPQYDWEEIDGEKRVTRINWKNKKLCGDISFAGLSELRKLVCSSDGLTGLLTGLDVRENTKLESLFCGGNQLTELDISKNMELYDLDCEINQLTELDLNNNPKLEYLYCNRN